MSFNRLYSIDEGDVTKGFPQFLKDAVFRWIHSHVVSNTQRPSVNNTRYTVLSDSFNARISAAFRRSFGDNLEEHLESITESDELIADYINYLLQKYPNIESAKELEDILSGANSEYTVYIQDSLRPSSSGGVQQPMPHWQPGMEISLQFRVPGEARKQLDIVSDRDRLHQAWKDLYDTSHQNYSSTVQKSLDEIAGAIRDRLYPEDTRTNLSDYATRIEQNIDTLDLPAKDRIDWVAIIKSLACFVDRRSVHNSGTDTDPEKEDAVATLHLCIALITILRSDT